MTVRSGSEIAFGLFCCWMGITVLRRHVEPQTGAALARMRSREFRRNIVATLILLGGIALLIAGIRAG